MRKGLLETTPVHVTHRTHDNSFVAAGGLTTTDVGEPNGNTDVSSFWLLVTLGGGGSTEPATATASGTSAAASTTVGAATPLAASAGGASDTSTTTAGVSAEGEAQGDWSVAAAAGGVRPAESAAFAQVHAVVSELPSATAQVLLLG